MLKIFVVTLAVVVLLVGAMALYVTTRPAEFRISRTISIAAPAATVFPYVNDFHKMAAWSPWEKVDPGMNRTYEGPETGVGSIYAWDGNDQVGAGRMTILESRPNELVKSRLENIRPFQSISETSFVFTPGAKGTRVEWALDGHRNFIEKLFCIFMNTDKVVGPEFEKGLAQLKDVIETAPANANSARSGNLKH